MNESISGTYKWNPVTERVEKVSDNASARDLFIKKYGINGDADRRAGYASLEAKGKLNQVADRECHRELSRR